MALYMDSDSEIKEAIHQQMKNWSVYPYPITNIEITWFQHEFHYRLEIHFCHDLVSAPLPLPSSPEGAVDLIVVGEIAINEEGSFDTIKKAGRDLYWRLRKEFPLLKRSLEKGRCYY